MDAFSDVLRVIRLAGGVFLEAEFTAPWCINGQISSVTSYGLSFGAGFGDIDNALNSSFGEFNGFVPVSIHRDFIHNSMVPEPSTWAVMITGMFGMGAMLLSGSDIGAPWDAAA